MRILLRRGQRLAIMRVMANYVIAVDAAKKAKMTPEEYSDACKHLTENAGELARMIGGRWGQDYADKCLASMDARTQRKDTRNSRKKRR